MFETFQQFISGRYEPHGYCLLWQPGLIWTHVVSDALIAAAYFSIPLALIRFVRRRDDIVFGRMIWLFALFILACGTTHVMGVWNLWHGDYGLEAIVKAITAAASVPTAILLWHLVPRALSIRSPSQLQQANDLLRASVTARRGACAVAVGDRAARTGGGRAPAGAKDGCDRAAHRGYRARFQQSASGGGGQSRPDSIATWQCVKGRTMGRQCRKGRGARDQTDGAAPRLFANPTARAEAA
jgi:hypothetical protein